MMMNPFRRSHGPRKLLLFLLFVVGAVLILGGLVMGLWNAILPSLLAVNAITYGQAVGLLVLCKILFGNFGPGGSYRRPPFGRSPYWQAKWTNMSDEEKARFREEWQKRCARRKM